MDMPRPLKIWRNVFRRRAVEEDLDQEVRAYVDLLAGEKVKTGVMPEDARRAALIELGGIEQTKESVRGVKAGALLWQLGTDLWHGFRIIRRNPGFAGVAIVSLALGIGVNSTVFSSLSALVLHPFPFPHVDRVMTAWEISSKSNEKEAVSPANFLDWKKESTSFEAMAASRPLDVTWTRSGEPERILSQLVTDGFFQVLGTNARAGRTFLKDEMQPGRDGVVVLSHAFWKTRLGSAPNAIGQTLVLGQKTYSIVGIMPETFNYPLETDVWVPLALTPIEQNERGARDLEVIGRLRAGITPASASVELQGIARRLAARYPKTNDGRGVRITTLLDEVDPGESAAGPGNGASKGNRGSIRIGGGPCSNRPSAAGGGGRSWRGLGSVGRSARSMESGKFPRRGSAAGVPLSAGGQADADGSWLRATGTRAIDFECATLQRSSALSTAGTKPFGASGRDLKRRRP
jgi:hypothetical protein